LPGFVATFLALPLFFPLALSPMLSSMVVLSVCRGATALI
jgi:hypothetical protein